MKTLSRIVDVICLAIKYICAILLGLMLVVSLIEIVRRYLFGRSYIWADELIRYSMVGVSILGGATAYREVGGMVSFDLLQSRVHGKERLLLEMVVNTIVLCFSAYILKNAVKTVMMPSIARQISIGLGISMSIPYSFIVAGMAVLLLLAVEKYFTIYANYKRGVYNRIPDAAAEGGDAQ